MKKTKGGKRKVNLSTSVNALTRLKLKEGVDLEIKELKENEEFNFLNDLNETRNESRKNGDAYK